MEGGTDKDNPSPTAPTHQNLSMSINVNQCQSMPFHVHNLMTFMWCLVRLVFIFGQLTSTKILEPCRGCILQPRLEVLHCHLIHLLSESLGRLCKVKLVMLVKGMKWIGACCGFTIIQICSGNILGRMHCTVGTSPEYWNIGSAQWCIFYRAACLILEAENAVGSDMDRTSPPKPYTGTAACQLTSTDQMQTLQENCTVQNL